MTESWPVTLWYSTLGVGDGHDYATRGYLTALMKAGYEGIRLPPSVTSSLMRFDATADPDILKFRELAQPPKHLRMKPLERIKAGDPRIKAREIGVDVEGNPVTENVGEQVVKGVDEFGNEVETEIKLCEGSVDLDKEQQFTSYEKLAVECVVIHHDPASISRNYTNFTKAKRPEGVAYVGITVWEADSIPNPVARILSELDAVIVPSVHTRMSLERSGVDTRIVVVPHTFDPEVWSRPKMGELRQPGDKYVFYGIGTPIERKNLGTLMRAYFTAFEGDDSVVLRLKSTGEHAALIALAKEALDASGIDAAKRPAMRLYTDHWDTAKMRAFHLDGDCFVSATRGEGFGLCEFEAKLCASRVITTGWGSAPEFLLEPKGAWTGEAFEQPDNGPYRTPEHLPEPHTNDTLVACRLTSVDGMFGVGCYDPKQKWADPDFDHLVSAMREAARQRISPDVESWDRLYMTHRPEVVGSQLADALMQARREAREEDDGDFWTEKTATAD
jgi:glycosyltransferase involved in cell wall biosynthesis